jgi:hypothetical protein
MTRVRSQGIAVDLLVNSVIYKQYENDPELILFMSLTLSGQHPCESQVRLICEGKY